MTLPRANPDVHAAQLALRIDPPFDAPILVIRAKQDRRVLRADCDWTRDRDGFMSSNGWRVCRGHVSHAAASHPDGNGWIAFAPDGVAEWWAMDPVTAMVRAEGGS